jgi:hypothetical protein
MTPPTRKPLSAPKIIVSSLATLLAMVGGSWLYHGWAERVRPDPDSIVNAMFGIEPYRDRRPSDEELIAAIRRSGDVNAVSRRHRVSILYAAVTTRRTHVVEWLLRNEADPNPNGLHPLSIYGLGTLDGDARLIDLLRNAGARDPAEN